MVLKRVSKTRKSSTVLLRKENPYGLAMFWDIHNLKSKSKEVVTKN